MSDDRHVSETPAARDIGGKDEHDSIELQDLIPHQNAPLLMPLRYNALSWFDNTHNSDNKSNTVEKKESTDDVHAIKRPRPSSSSMSSSSLEAVQSNVSPVFSKRARVASTATEIEATVTTVNALKIDAEASTTSPTPSVAFSYNMRAERRALLWTTSWEAVNSILTRLLIAQEPLLAVDKALAYNHLFNLCVSSYEQRVFVEISRLLKHHCQLEYEKMSSLTGETLLKSFTRFHTYSSRAATIIFNIARYLQRYWIPANCSRSPASDLPKVQPLIDVYYSLMRELVWERLEPQLWQALCSFVDKTRLRSCMLRTSSEVPLFDSLTRQLQLDPLFVTRLLRAFIRCTDKQTVATRIQPFLGNVSFDDFAQLYSVSNEEQFLSSRLRVVGRLFVWSRTLLSSPLDCQRRVAIVRVLSTVAGSFLTAAQFDRLLVVAGDRASMGKRTLRDVHSAIVDCDM
jgi:hypothetical protein